MKSPVQLSERRAVGLCVAGCVQSSRGKAGEVRKPLRADRAHHASDAALQIT